MSNPNDKYWRERFAAIEAGVNKAAASTYAKIERNIMSAQRELEKEIARWYSRFADNNQIDLAEARRLMKSNELAEFRWTVEDYIQYAKQNTVSGQWIKQLENASARVHVSRLEALKMHMQHATERIFGNQLDALDVLSKRQFLETYNHSMFEVQKGFNIGWDVGGVDERKLDAIISKPWTTDKMTFSGRIWRDKQRLTGELEKALTQGLLLGKTSNEMIDDFAHKMQTTKNNARRLIMTESSYISALAELEVYKELDVERFEVLATLDKITSDICQEMDGRVFSVRDFQPGVTANPFHPFCRSTTVPHFDDDFGERAARDIDGNTYYVPSDMKYPEWKAAYVDGGDKTRYTEQTGETNKNSEAEMSNTGEELLKTLHEIESAKKELNHEVGTLLSRDGKIIKEYQGSEHSVSVPENDRVLFEDAIFTHNHPGGRCFTTQDIRNFADDGLYEVRVSTPQETFFSLKKGTGELNQSIGNVMREEKVGNMMEAAKSVQQRYPGLTGVERDEKIYDLMAESVDKWLTENVAEFGYVYTKGVL